MSGFPHFRTTKGKRSKKKPPSVQPDPKIPKQFSLLKQSSAPPPIAPISIQSSAPLPLQSSRKIPSTNKSTRTIPSTNNGTYKRTKFDWNLFKEELENYPPEPMHLPGILRIRVYLQKHKHEYFFFQKMFCVFLDRNTPEFEPFSVFQKRFRRIFGLKPSVFVCA